MTTLRTLNETAEQVLAIPETVHAQQRAAKVLHQIAELRGRSSRKRVRKRPGAEKRGLVWEPDVTQSRA